MEKATKRNAFGIAQTKVKKISIEYPDARLYAILCLQPAGNPENAVWLSQLARATDWRFRESHFRPLAFHDNQQQAFPIYYAKRPGNKISLMIRNTAEKGEKKLLSYDSSACCRISQPNTKVLPNQLSLFEEEPEEQLSTEDENLGALNPYDVDCWNAVTKYLAKQSKPLTEFSWLLPVNYYNCAFMRPLLNHLERISGLRYRFLSYETIQDHELLHEIKQYEENLHEQAFSNRSYSGDGRNSSNERSS